MARDVAGPDRQGDRDSRAAGGRDPARRRGAPAARRGPLRPLDTEQARQALVDVEACSMCRPDTDLGLL
ncbi:DUF6233 domain-containing protein [Streptomyces albidoflavus]